MRRRWNGSVPQTRHNHAFGKLCSVRALTQKTFARVGTGKRGVVHSLPMSVEERRPGGHEGPASSGFFGINFERPSGEVSETAGSPQTVRVSRPNSTAAAASTRDETRHLVDWLANESQSSNPTSSVSLIASLRSSATLTRGSSSTLNSPQLSMSSGFSTPGLTGNS